MDTLVLVIAIVISLKIWEFDISRNVTGLWESWGHNSIRVREYVAGAPDALDYREYILDSAFGRYVRI
jgi:hypothetical protein